ncbi:MAG: alkaline phosphatase family protein [Thermoanaerobaculales bacterium]|nr:alkaline phosphatase family protein [Thermoanaerobaculales bacterium]
MGRKLKNFSGVCQARPSHQLSAATADLAYRAVLFAIRLLRRTVEYASSPHYSKTHAAQQLCGLATKPGEKVGLAATFLIALVLAIPGCRSGAPGTAEADRVVMVSFDGVGVELLQDWLADPDVATAGGLGGMVSSGVVADRVRMANPTLTSVNHATLITGEWPTTTGIVSNGFRTVGDPLTERTNGFSAPLGAKALWQKAREAGRRTGVLLWPGADAKTEQRRGDFGMVWPENSLVRSKIYELLSEEAEKQPELPPQDGLDALSWRIPVSSRSGHLMDIEVAVLDATPDGRPRFDTVAVRKGGDLFWRYIDDRGWFETQLEAEAPEDSRPRQYGAWSKILHLDRHRGHLRLYRGSFNRLMAYPEAFEDELTAAVGPWPGVPDSREVERWWLDAADGIDLDTYIEQIERLDTYLDDIAAWVMDHEEFRLLVAYYPTPDEYQHASLIVDRDQWAWSEGKAFAARLGLERVGRSMDRSVAKLWSALDAERDVLVVVSDHGLLPIHDEVLINQALAAVGLVETEESRGRTRIAPSSPMAAFTSGSCAHLYLNLKGREPGGVVEALEADGYLRRAARALADLGVEGEAVVERIAARDELAALDLDHPNAGDLVVFLKPGYAASSRLGGDAIRPSRYYGQHGYLNHHNALCGVFLARGAPAGRAKLEEIQAVDVEPMVAAWLGLSADLELRADS